MKKIISLFLSINLILLVACSTGTSTAKLEIIPQGTELSGVLEISSANAPREGSGWWSLATGFMDLHPNVEIIHNDNGISFDLTREYDESVLMMEHYISDLRVKLMAGDAPDIIYDDLDNISDFSTSGLLADLNEYVENDETFKEEDFYMNVIKSGELGGTLASFSTLFSGIHIKFNKDMVEASGVDLEAVQVVDYQLVFEIYNKVLDSGKFPELKSIDRNGGYGNTLFLYDEFYSCFDMESLTANFDTENFRNYLVTMKDYGGSTSEKWVEISNVYELFEDDTYLIEFVHPTVYQDVERFLIETDKESKPYPLVSSAGDHYIVVSSSMSIPKDAKNPALAWEFIKYCAYESEKVATFYDYEKVGHWDGDRFSGSIPINKNNFEKYLDVTMIGYPDDYKEKFLAVTSMGTDLIVKQYYYFGNLFAILGPSFEDYYNGLLSEDECVKNLQERTELYFAEIE